jgi:hypothetical protein
MTLETAIRCAREEAAAAGVRVIVVESPREMVEQGSMRFFPCRKDWFEGFGQNHTVVAEAFPNGQAWRAK